VVVAAVGAFSPRTRIGAAITAGAAVTTATVAIACVVERMRVCSERVLWDMLLVASIVAINNAIDLIVVVAAGVQVTGMGVAIVDQGADVGVDCESASATVLLVGLEVLEQLSHHCVETSECNEIGHGGGEDRVIPHHFDHLWTLGNVNHLARRHAGT